MINKLLKVLLVIVCIHVGITTYAQNTYHNGHQYIDLGLSVKWANYNIGANTVEGYGYYFSWGEIFSKRSYESSVLNYIDITDISGNKKYDAASATWGGNWRIPTKEEVEELINKCSWFWCTINDISGVNITGPNGNNIFLPLAGFKRFSNDYHESLAGFYWTSTQDNEIIVSDLRFSFALSIIAINKENCRIECGSHPRDRGFCIRAVLP